MSSFSSRLLRFSKNAVSFLFGLAASWLFVSCLAANGGSLPDKTWVQCLLFSAVCLLALFLAKRDISLPSASDGSSFPRSFAGALALLWVLCIQPVPVGDAASVQAAAVDLCNGYTYLFQPGEYLYFHPEQSGLVLLHMLLYRISPNVPLPFQMLNILCYIGILFFLGEWFRELSPGSRCCRNAQILGILFLPLLFSVTDVSGLLPGLFFTLAALVLTLRFRRCPHRGTALCACLCLFFAVAVEPKAGIAALGLILYLCACALGGNRHCVFLALLLSAGWLLGRLLPIPVLEGLSGCSLRNGLPPVAELAMGLRENGCADGYAVNAYFDAGLNRNALRLSMLKSIYSSGVGFLRNPGLALSFFLRKSADQWADPLFQTLQRCLSMHQASGKAIAPWAEALLSAPSKSILFGCMNLVQTLVYGGLVLWACLPGGNRKHPSEYLSALLLLIGFAYSCLWPADTRITLCLVLFCFPLALSGFKRLTAICSQPNRGAVLCTFSGKVRLSIPILLMAAALLLRRLLPAA